MKKFILCLAAIGSIICTAEAISVQNNSTSVNYASRYEFVGEYKFCDAEMVCSDQWLNVYTDGYNYKVRAHMVDTRGNRYDKDYMLMKCDVQGFNYYFSCEGKKWYTKI